MTTDQINAKLDTLRTELSATARAKFPDGAEVQYRTTDEILKAIAYYEDLLRTSSSGNGRVRLAQHQRGAGPSRGNGCRD